MFLINLLFLGLSFITGGFNQPANTYNDNPQSYQAPIKKQPVKPMSCPVVQTDPTPGC